LDYQEIARTLELFKPGKLIEIRSVGPRPLSGYFKDVHKLIACIKSNPKETFYFVLNDIRDDCYSREQSEKLIAKPKSATTDNDIGWREWLLIDADPRRVSGVSSTDEEKAKALAVTRSIYRYLRNMGFPSPVVADSGNGYHLLYRVNMKNIAENTELVKRFLQAVDMMFSDDCVGIDTSVFNASRITKLYGTVTQKGANTEERPHRQSRLLDIPESLSPASTQLLKKIADLLPKPAPPHNRNHADEFDIEDFISKHGIRVSKKGETSDGVKYVLEECVFDSNHKAPDAAIFVSKGGAIGYHCFHNSCMSQRWQDVRLKFEPDAYDPKEQPARTTSPPPNAVRQQAQQPSPKGEKFLRLQDIQRLDRSQIVSVVSGVHALDKKIIGFNKGEFSVWSGGNGSGKSTILSQLALEAVNNGFRVALFSGELTSHRVKNWIHLQASGPLYNLPTGYENVFYTPQEIGEKIDAWTSDKLWIYNNDYGMEANSVLNDIKAHIEKHQTDVVIIDNLMSLDLTQVRGDKYDRQSVIALTVASMAKQHNVHAHFVCHPRKPAGFLRKADIAGTADLTNAADNVFMMHRVNNDFRKYATDYFDTMYAESFFNYSNVMEVMKNRDLGVEDELIGMFYEASSKRLLNTPNEAKAYKWDDFSLQKAKGKAVNDDSPFMQMMDETGDSDNPFLQDNLFN